MTSHSFDSELEYYKKITTIMNDIQLNFQNIIYGLWVFCYE